MASKKSYERQDAEMIIEEARRAWGSLGWARLSEDQRHAEASKVFMQRVISQVDETSLVAYFKRVAVEILRILYPGE